jgi:type VI secretion system protein ImpC
VTEDPSASQEAKSRYPLADASVVVEDVPGNPGYYTSKFYLRPHFQLEGLTVSLRLVTKLPSEKSASK